MKNEQIEKIVEQLHQKFGVKNVPVQIEDIASKLEIKIKKAPAPSDDISGLLIRKNGRALIGINENESHVRQRFTIAHELGHFFLHPAKDAFVDYRDNQTGIIRSSKERQANMFAASFLIPQKQITLDVKRIAKGGIFDSEIEILAKKYDVSKEAMNYRLINLGLNK